LEKNAREIESDSGLAKPSNNGIHKNEDNGIEVVDLATDIPRSYNGELGPNLTDFDVHSGDNRLLSKDELLKSLSDIDNIVINNSPAAFPEEDMLMHYINKSAALNKEPESSNLALNFTSNQDGRIRNELIATEISKGNKTDDDSANDEDDEAHEEKMDKRGSVFHQSRRKGEINKNICQNGKHWDTSQVLGRSISSSNTTYNLVLSTEVVESISIDSKSFNKKCEDSSTCNSNTTLEQSKTVTKKAAMEAVRAILPHKNDNNGVSSDNYEAPLKRARRACVQQFQGINIYKEDESETTCTLESDDETSEDDDDDADESSIQEDADNEKGKNKEKDTHIKTNNNQM